MPIGPNRPFKSVYILFRFKMQAESGKKITPHKNQSASSIFKAFAMLRRYSSAQATIESITGLSS